MLVLVMLVPMAMLLLLLVAACVTEEAKTLATPLTWCCPQT